MTSSASLAPANSAACRTAAVAVSDPSVPTTTRRYGATYLASAAMDGRRSDRADACDAEPSRLRRSAEQT